LPLPVYTHSPVGISKLFLDFVWRTFWIYVRVNAFVKFWGPC